MPQNSTLGGESLSAQQLQALDALLKGETVSKAAGDAGVDRSTVHRWLREDYHFLAEFNRGRRELQQALLTRLLRLAEDATASVEKAVKAGDARSSVALLRGLGLLSGEAPCIGPGDPEVLRANAEEARANAEERRLLRELTRWPSNSK